MHHPDTFGCSQDFFRATKRPNYNGRKTWETFKNLHTTPRCSIYGICTYIYHQFKPNVGKCSSPMEHMRHGYDFIWNHKKNSQTSMRPTCSHINDQSHTRWPAFSASRRSILASWWLWKSGSFNQKMGPEGLVDFMCLIQIYFGFNLDVKRNVPLEFWDSVTWLLILGKLRWYPSLEFMVFM